VKLYIDITKLNSKRKNNRTTDRKSLNRLSRQQNVFTHTAQVSLTVMILFDKNLPMSILTQLPNKHALQSICFLFLIELSGYK